MTRFGETDFTIGVEEEFQLVHPETGELVSRMDEVYEAADPGDGELQSELFQSMIETATPVCADVDELREELVRLRSLLDEEGRDRNLRIAASGTHPFAKWEEREVTPDERYRELIRDIRLPIKRELVFGQHVHIGVGSAEEALFVTNHLRADLPLLLALSVNSPFWRGIDSGLQSARLRVFDAMPRSGIPRTFVNWSDLQGAVDLYKAAGAIEDMTKIWWDVRPRPTLGTVEVRIADLPTDVEASIGLAALTQALVRDWARRYRENQAVDVHLQPEAIRENRWRALRDGLEADLVHLPYPEQLRTRSIEETLQATFKRLEPTIDELGIEDELRRLEQIVDTRETGAARQREVHERTDSLREVVHDVAERTVP